ncbi:hypothetical protein M9H77_24410 [Catharanthus roseus]|uniref:Uncharacterized protein n=1 Tax=Catharanthus roseus TaxID=4058 RepID=A0ACC0AYP0_CATRO|nr:hypothetical protein M9H77_24410 [Catharanthus roseus]
MNYGVGLTKPRKGLIAWAKRPGQPRPNRPVQEQPPTSIFSTCLLPPSQPSLGFCCYSQGILCLRGESAPPRRSSKGLGWRHRKLPLLLLLLLVATLQLAVAITAAHALLGACCCSAVARRHCCCSSPLPLQLVAVARSPFGLALPAVQYF